MREPHFDPTDPVVALDPYPAYEALREALPVWYSKDLGLHFITRHADVAAAWRDRRLGSAWQDRRSSSTATAPDSGARDIVETGPVWRDPRYADFARFERWDLLAIEPPDHTMLRRLVLAAFTPRAVAAQRAGVQSRLAGLLSGAEQTGSFDIVRDVAEPLSLGVICDLIGVPGDDAAYILGLSHAVVAMYEPSPSDDVKAKANAAAGTLLAYTHELIRRRRAGPADDLLSGLIGATVDGQGLVDDQIASTVMVLLMAGHEASVNAVSNGVAAFAAHPDEWRAMRDGSVPVTTAVEEILRWDPPLQYFTRWVLDDGFRVGGLDGVAIPAGQRVALMIGSANRDGRRYPDPATFRIARGESAHLSFGGGIHFCLGAPLARIELEAVFSALAPRASTLSVGPGARRRAGFQFRGYSRLPIFLGR